VGSVQTQETQSLVGVLGGDQEQDQPWRQRNSLPERGAKPRRPVWNGGVRGVNSLSTREHLGHHPGKKPMVCALCGDTSVCNGGRFREQAVNLSKLSKKGGSPQKTFRVTLQKKFGVQKFRQVVRLPGLKGWGGAGKPGTSLQRSPKCPEGGVRTGRSGGVQNGKEIRKHAAQRGERLRPWGTVATVQGSWNQKKTSTGEGGKKNSSIFLAKRGMGEKKPWGQVQKKKIKQREENGVQKTHHPTLNCKIKKKKEKKKNKKGGGSTKPLWAPRKKSMVTCFSVKVGVKS